MEKFRLISRIREVYREGGNIIEFLRSIDGAELNSVEDILISYDLQAGSYVSRFAQDSSFKKTYGAALARVIDSIGPFNSLLEAGVGEATTLVPVLKSLNHKPKDILGFDISWSRLKFARGILRDFHFPHVQLFTGNLFEIPLADDAVDLVYTSHALEPNGGREQEALKELYRVARRYIVLLEPAYEMASPEAQARMRKHSYVTNLHGVAKKLGYPAVEHRLFDHISNPLNPTGLMIIKKEGTADSAPTPVSPVCPITRTSLEQAGDSLLFSRESLLACPVIEGIPCLLGENSVLVSHMLTGYDDFKKAHGLNLGGVW